MRKYTQLATITALSLALGACATSKEVDKKIEERIAASQAQTNQKIESVASQVEDLQQKQKQTDVRLDQLSQEAKDALKRAEEAGVLAKGKVVFQQTFGEDRIKFGVDKYALSKDSQTALEDFAGKVKALQAPFCRDI